MVSGSYLRHKQAKGGRRDIHSIFGASPTVVNGTKAARFHAGPLVVRDPYPYWLPVAASLWQEAQNMVIPTSEPLVLEDTMLKKPHAQHLRLVLRRWTGPAPSRREPGAAGWAARRLGYAGPAHSDRCVRG